MSTGTSDVSLVGEETVGNIARAALFAAATSATAPVAATHPLAPNIPITLQTLWVFLAGMFLGPVWAGVAFGLYLVAGVIGLPVFAGGASGLGVVLGPTGGYLVGFPLAAIAVGAVAHGRLQPRRLTNISVVRLVVAAVAGSVVIYAFGALGLVVVQNIGLAAAVSTGVLPFLPTAAIKTGIAVVIARSDAVVPR